MNDLQLNHFYEVAGMRLSLLELATKILSSGGQCVDPKAVLQVSKELELFVYSNNTTTAA